MKLEDFLEQWSYRPCDTVEVAEAASEVTDDDTLRRAATAFIGAELALERALERVGFEFG